METDNVNATKIYNFNHFINQYLLNQYYSIHDFCQNAQPFYEQIVCWFSQHMSETFYYDHVKRKQVPTCTLARNVLSFRIPTYCTSPANPFILVCNKCKDMRLYQVKNLVYIFCFIIDKYKNRSCVELNILIQK